MKRIEAPQFTASSWFPAFLTQLINEFMTFFVHRVRAAKPFLDDDVEIVHADMAAPPVDQETGIFCSINGFHRLSTDRARQVLAEISAKRQPIVIVEGNNDNWWQAIGMTIFVPLTVILSAPFVRPFRVTRLIFTYLIPVLPIVTSLDGIAGLFRLFNPDDLNELTAQIGTPDYGWRSGKLDNGRGGKIMYLLGWPE